MDALATRAPSAASLGCRLKEWRKKRGFSQLALAHEVGVSARHLCFVETGRSSPSARMMHRLSEGLDVPLRERNELFLLAGYAPPFSEAPLDAPALSQVRQIVNALLSSQDPYPGMAMDRYWNIVEMNAAAKRMILPLCGDDQPNAIELFLGNPAVKEMILNWQELAHHTRERLRSQIRHVGGEDARLLELGARADALLAGYQFAYSAPTGPTLVTKMKMGDQVLSTLSTIAAFSGASDVFLDDLRIELIFPADEAAAACFRAAAEAG